MCWRQRCRDGEQLARVLVKRDFRQGFVSWISLGLIAPATVVYTCANAGDPPLGNSSGGEGMSDGARSRASTRSRNGRISTRATSRRSRANMTSFMPQQSAGLTVEDLKETTRQFQALIADARKKGLKARAIGSAWSLSRAPTTTGWALNTNRLRGRLKIAAGGSRRRLSRHAPTRREGLYLFQCGNTVADVNKVIESKDQGRSLFTSGAANGQTIAGATSCGTHGSALEHGALHDHIVAIHLIATGNGSLLDRAQEPRR